MLKISEANTLQKEVTAAILKIILKALNCYENYRILDDGEDLMIRQSTGTPPPERRQVRLAMVLSHLPFLKIKLGAIQTRAAIGVIRIPTFFINEIDEAFIAKFMSASTAVKKPVEVDDLVWSRLPNEALENWTRFSAPLQKHLIECAATDLATLFSKAPEDAVGVTFLSPVGLDAPSFPVRLPLPPAAGGAGGAGAAAADVRADVNKVYDIVEVVKMRGKNPLTRASFTLEEVLPASDALKILKERVEKAVGDDEPGAGTARPR